MQTQQDVHYFIIICINCNTTYSDKLFTQNYHLIYVMVYINNNIYHLYNVLINL